VTKIGKGAFFDCKELLSINIPNNITIIEPATFVGCEKMTEITIPIGVTLIGEKAFYECYALTAYNVEKGNSTYSSIDGVLYSHDATILISCPIGKKGSYTIPQSVITIAKSAFLNCNLTDVYASWNNPPVVNEAQFGISAAKIANLHVPKGTKKAYSKMGWEKYFTKIIESK